MFWVILRLANMVVSFGGGRDVFILDLLGSVGFHQNVSNPSLTAFDLSYLLGIFFAARACVS
jgi:hypothetical protein